MPIVDFAQDPSAPYGTGNFRDEKGRVMYLHDPETAQQFAKTMPGAPLGKQVADESEALAARQMGDTGATLGSQVAMESDAIARGRFGGNAPSRGPDLRLAEARAPLPGPGGRGAALVSQYDQTRSVLDAPPSGSTAEGVPPSPPPGYPAPAPDAPPGAPPVAGAAPAAPTAPGAPTGAGAALVSNYDATQAKLEARSKPRDIEMPKAYGSGGIPLSGVREGQSVTIDEGRPVENAVEQLADEAPDVQNQIDQIRSGNAAKDAAVDRAYGAQISAMDAQRQAQLERAKIARKERDDAAREMAVVQRELKANDKSFDPDRVVKNMSTGSRIGMIILATLNGAFGATIGQKSNGVIDALNLEIDRDIERQKNEVANRKATLGNDYKRFLDMGLDAKQAEALARDKAEAAIFQVKDLEAKRVGAKGEYARQAEQLIAPIRVAWSQRRGDVMKETEAKVKRAQDVSKANEVPKVVPMTPQDVLALLNVKKERIEQANAEVIGAALEHEVSPEEAQRLKQDSQEFGDKSLTNKDTLYKIKTLAEAIGLKKGRNGWEGDADPGSRPLGISQTDTAVRVDRLWNDIVQARIQASKREPAARLQDAAGKAIERPFFDNQIAPLLNDLEGLVRNADQNLRQGYGEAATLWDRTPAEGGRPKPPVRPGAAAAPSGRPGTTPAQRAAAEAERKKTAEMMKAPGNPVVE
jgi:hypothetical protein